MPAKSPLDISDPTLRLTIKANGSPIKDSYPVESVYITHELNRISYAEISLIDGTVESADFPISDSADLIPGNTIEITAGYGSDAETSIFKGVIVKQAIRINDGEPFALIITCKHKAVTMCYNKTEAQFSSKTDSAIMNSIASNYGVTATVDSTTAVSEAMFQKLATDWDFVLARADFNGFVIALDGDEMTIGKPKVDGDAVLRIGFGESILSFDAELSAEKQPTALQVSSWDIKQQSLLVSNAAEPSLNAQGNLSAKTLSGQLNQKELKLTSNTPLTNEDLTVWGNSSLLKIRLAAIRGVVSFIGNGTVKPNTVIELAGVGDRFNGNAYVTMVNHVLESGNWTTKVKFGLDEKFAYENKDFAYPNASGQLPPINGLQVATVKKIFGDPDSQFRILITLPSNAENQDGIWARMANFHATNKAGAGFLPEVGDEVIIGFLENDPRYPVILGSLYSTAKTAAATAADNNNYIKTIITKSQLKMTFDDEKKILKLETPAGNYITFSDDAKSIEIKDQHSNSITMDSNGISVQSSKDIVLDAKGKISLTAVQNVEIEAQMDVKMTGLNINNNANIGFVAKGAATAELSASGQTTVKGAIVMIN
ncbi:type VI secretion system tip protein VgrG [Flavobacterium sp. TR2]|uniref:type VI secretion system tip protein VgrG n=1 Tax=Flavobacterium sp. TR2 TaxID=2977321 RepID=UPI0021B0CDF6|nr:type VI secretion system tip protein VgrG [Flavobacterium sp. TR2]UWY27416.1 type VI secretion system tip protein VgrG [Flavobacterium sp. TR2]